METRGVVDWCTMIPLDTPVRTENLSSGVMVVKSAKDVA